VKPSGQKATQKENRKLLLQQGSGELMIKRSPIKKPSHMIILENRAKSHPKRK